MLFQIVYYKISAADCLVSLTAAYSVYLVLNINNENKVKVEKLSFNKLWRDKQASRTKWLEQYYLLSVMFQHLLTADPNVNSGEWDAAHAVKQISIQHLESFRSAADPPCV